MRNYMWRLTFWWTLLYSWKLTILFNDQEYTIYWQYCSSVCSNSFREQMTKKIQEQENLGKALREKQKNLRDNQETNVKQVKMWRDVERLLLIKQKLASGDNSRSFEEPAYNSRPSEDRLILWWFIIVTNYYSCILTCVECWWLILMTRVDELSQWIESMTHVDDTYIPKFDCNSRL